MKRIVLISASVMTYACSYAQWTNLHAPATSTSAIYMYAHLAVSNDGKNIASYSQKTDLSTFHTSDEYITSHDFGATWQEYTAPSLPDLEMFWDGDVLYVQEAANMNQLKKSVDYGASFTVQNTAYNVWNNVLQSPNGKWYLGYQSDIYVSADKGVTWTVSATSLGAGFMEYTSAQNGNLVSTSTSGTLYSTDSGAHWHAATFPPGFSTTDATNSVSRSSTGDLIYLCHTSTQVYRSADNGVSWTQVSATLPANPIKLLFAGTDLVTLASNGATYKSSDEGLTFTTMTAAGALLSGGNDMVASAHDIFICGNSGIFKYNSSSYAANIAAQHSEIHTYPNPCRNVVYIDGPLSATMYLVSDEKGQIVLRGKMTDGSINVSRLCPGLYNLSLYDDQGNRYSSKVARE